MDQQLRALTALSVPNMHMAAHNCLNCSTRQASICTYVHACMHTYIHSGKMTKYISCYSHFCFLDLPVVFGLVVLLKCSSPHYVVPKLLCHPPAGNADDSSCILLFTLRYQCWRRLGLLPAGETKEREGNVSMKMNK